MNPIRSFRLVSVTAAFALTLGLTGWVSAQPVSQAPLALQTTAAAVTPTPVDVSVPVVLTSGVEAQSPLDNDQVYQRQFKFKGTANQLVTVTTRILTGNMSLNVSVIDQASAEIASIQGKFITTSQFTLKLPQDGNYVITISHADPGSGDFEAGTIAVSVAPASTGQPAASPK
jgi:hypothetical protein